jgi:hypothetical protein
LDNKREGKRNENAPGPGVAKSAFNCTHDHLKIYLKSNEYLQMPGNSQMVARNFKKSSTQVLSG